MKISIITVCKNEEKRIEKTLISVKNQTYKNIEHLLIDGLSTDKTTDIINKYKPDYFISEADKGLYQAMNKGIAKSCGDMLLFLNAGDYLAADDVIELAIKELNSDTDIFSSRVFLLNPKTQLSTLSKYSNISKEFFLLGAPQHPASLIKRALFDEIGFFNENFKIAADREFFVKAFMQDKIFQQSKLAMSYFELGGISATDRINCRYEDDIILKMYFYFCFPQIPKQKADIFLNKEKTATLKELSVFYQAFNKNQKQLMKKGRFFKDYIIYNINSIKFSWNVDPKMLFYYFGYKIKYFFKKPNK